MKRCLYLPILLLLQLLPARAYCQEFIYHRDTGNINFVARTQIQYLNELLNGISSSDNGEKDIQEAIENSFEQKLFLSRTFMVEDDIDPASHTTEQAQQTQVSKYLADLDLFYAKSDVPTIAFSNIRLSHLKRGDSGLYVKAYYDELFKGKHSTSSVPYTVNHRVAEIRIARDAKKWRAYIERLGFAPADLTHDTVNNVIVYLGDQVDQKANSEAEAERAELLSEQSRFGSLMNEGNLAFASDDYAVAYLKFTEALQLNRLALEPRNKIRTIKGIIEKNGQGTGDYLYDQFLQKARLSENQRKYEQARQYYYLALQNKPTAVGNIDSILNALNGKLRLVTELDEKYNAGRYEDAVKGYNAVIKKDKTNSDFYLGRAKCYDKMGQHSNALSDYSDAIRLDANNLEALRLRADYYKRMGKYPEALTDLKFYLLTDKYDPDIYAERAAIQMLSNNTGAALDELNEAIRIKPEYARLYLEKGLIHYRANNNRDAYEAFNIAVKKSPKYSQALFYRGLCLLKYNKVSGAAEDFGKAREAGLDKAYIRQLDALAETYYTGYQTRAAAMRQSADAATADSAREYIDKAILINPGSAQYRFRRGELYSFLKDYYTACDNFSDALALNPTYIQAWLKRGLANYCLDEYDSSVLDYRQALQLIEPKLEEDYQVRPFYCSALKGLSDAYYKLGQYPAAITQYELALRKAKELGIKLPEAELSQLYDYLGHAHYERGDIEIAMEHLTKAVRYDEGNKEAWFHKSLAEIRLNKLDDATTDIWNALRIDTFNSQMLYTLGIIYKLQGNYKEAVRCFNTSLQRDSTELATRSTYNRGYCYLQTGDYTKALQDYQRVMTMAPEQPSPYFNNELGRIYLSLGLVDSSYQCYYRAYATNNGDGIACYGIAATFVARQKPDDAIAWFEKAFQQKSMRVPRNFIREDKQIAGIRDDKRFKELVQKYY